MKHLTIEQLELMRELDGDGEFVFPCRLAESLHKEGLLGRHKSGVFSLSSAGRAYLKSLAELAERSAA